jgi:aryl sulfotransferase
MAAPPHRYVSPDEDSGRWLGFPFRDGDIVISARSKSGATWTQMVCALLVFGTRDLPRPLGELSPWLDHLVRPRDDVLADLAKQQHRRFIKTHTPLDGVPLDARATYIVVARNPLDMAVSLYHQGDNIDRGRVRELTGADRSPPLSRPLVRDWLLSWIGADADPRESMDSLPGVMWHLSDAWARREEPNVVLVRYADLSADLDGEMRRLAEQLSITVREAGWPDLVQAATFEEMRGQAEWVVPNQGGILKEPAAFFRCGRSGAGRELLTDDEMAAYEDRVTDLAPSDMLAWLHAG